MVNQGHLKMMRWALAAGKSVGTDSRHFDSRKKTKAVKEVGIADSEMRRRGPMPLRCLLSRSAESSLLYQTTSHLAKFVS